LVAGVYQPTPTQAEGLTATFYLKPEHTALAAPYGESAGKIFSFFSDRFGPLPWRRLAIMEIPDGSLPSFSAPGMVLLAERSWDPKVNYKLLAREIAAQWWGALVSPATPADDWLGDGLARYAEALYVQHLAGDIALSQMLDDFVIGALLHEEVAPVASGRVARFTPEYRSVVVNKGAMIFHMLRGILGEQMFFDVLRTFSANFANRSATTKDFQELVSRLSGQDLSYFFAQWLYSVGIPNFSTEYVIYRTQKGFKVVGKIKQDLETFRMPIEIKIETEGNPETKKVEVIGTSSEYVVDTFGRPKNVILDPNNNVLKWNPELQVRVAVARGEELVEQAQPYEAVREYQKALDVNRTSSLANFRIGEAFFVMNNYQASANAFREALNGDLAPKWTEVWSHIYLGKIFDLTGQRERALREYQKALDTNDNTQGAQTEAQRWLNEPFKGQKT
jgi:aminopeptidase N